eukprot:14117439-Alexandrium_andersonii.AAC.1
MPPGQKLAGLQRVFYRPPRSRPGPRQQPPPRAWPPQIRRPRRVCSLRRARRSLVGRSQVRDVLSKAFRDYGV